MDIYLALEKIMPAAKFLGAFEDHSKKEYDDIEWQDERSKPTWSQIKNAWQQISAMPKVDKVSRIEARLKLLEQKLNVTDAEILAKRVEIAEIET